MSSSNFGSMQSLPVDFVTSMRTLFEILDEYNHGVIHIDDIESHWHGIDSHDLPRGLLPAFRKVANPKNGTLTFDTFMGGIKLALSSTFTTNHDTNTENRYSIANDDVLSKRTRDQMLRQSQSSSNVLGSSSHFATNSLQQRTFSMSHLPDSRDYNDRLPPSQKGSDRYQSSPPSRPANNGWSRLEARASVASMSALDKYPKDVASDRPPPEGTVPLRTYRQNHTRRHTVTSGVDYHMIKRMKALELQKDVLLQGLETVSQARDWYQGAIARLQELQQRLTTDTQDPQDEYDQERSEVMTARVKDVNHQLNALIRGTYTVSDALIRGTYTNAPAHMNLAVPSSANQISRGARSLEKSSTLTAVTEAREQNDNHYSKLKSQVRQLSQELGHKSERIGQLEHEKAQLIREMFQASSKHRNGTFDDASYI